MGDAALSSTPRPERPLSHDPALPIGTPGKGGGPSSDGVWIPSQGLRRTRSRPSLGQEPDSVPSFTLPGSRRQNKPPVQIPAIHLPLFEKPVLFPVHPSPTPPRLRGTLTQFLCKFTPCFCVFHLGFGLVPAGRSWTGRYRAGSMTLKIDR